MAEGPLVQPLARWGLVADVSLDLLAALAEQPPAHVPAQHVAGVLGERASRTLQQVVGELDLARARALAQTLENVPIPVARREVHRSVRIDGIEPQDSLDHRDGLEEVRPVERVEEAQRADRVGDRDLIGGLALLVTNGLAIEAKPARRELPREPTVDRLGAELGSLETLRQPQEEHQRIGARVLLQFDQKPRQTHRVFLLYQAQALGPGVGGLLVAVGVHDDAGEPPKVLHQRDSQHDRHGPALADRERGDLLVRLHVAEKAVALEPGVGVGDQTDRELVDAGQLGERPLGETGELDSVVGREVLPNLDDLVLDQVVVVEQPFTGRRDDPSSLRDVVELPIVRGEVRRRLRGELEQRSRLGARLAGDGLGARDLAGRLGEPVGAEQLGTKRRVVRCCPNRLGGFGHVGLLWG